MSPTIASPPASLPTTETAPGQGWTPGGDQVALGSSQELPLTRVRAARHGALRSSSQKPPANFLSHLIGPK